MAFEHAPAKLNLALHVRGRRADGYHDLETLFAFTAFGDSLTAEPARDLSLTIEGDFAGPAGQGDDNLVLRAARLLQRETGIRTGAALHLTKRIPVAAGLGGGSADAAAALRLLAREWGVERSRADLTAMAAELGADVPACVASQTCLGTGRGEVLTPVDAGVAGMPVLIMNPRVPVPTGPVFAGWDGVDRGPLDPELHLGELRNDLEAPAVALVPAIATMIEWLAAREHCVVARMSGSGGSVFALFRSMAAASAASRAVPAEWWSAYTSMRQPGGDGGPQ
ncbi:4-(cytidine 5'-diphospho)-2-C-methyl-D-erythritol kinase [Glacieibacterium frigidum]|uniref:4-diphosphocytidyl-2-C-methyl-D-erythritol kinase n=1 Tax=Glacieibacterium frigidum TaxID=2593303 RepID=A0A552UHZ7_9SPHN|nr:4-(cytidine 5'-diphospho)-2-C-methyl-D-erythritol kinase [Glacieibacterium frigidum]TRW17846.1 4-(cytidine 5'-diphospho)-2-C-methyl-D-erythritol kinase [Glacieibacterium frigidum]